MKAFLCRHAIHGERLRRGLRVAGLATALALLSSGASARTYAVNPLDVGSGFSLSGSIETDGSIGMITAANITDWHIRVSSITDYVYTPANTNNWSSLVTATPTELRVATSPGGIADGGSLAFVANHYFGVKPADFSALSGQGGEASYFAGGAFDVRALNQPEAIDYVAAVSSEGTVFDLVPLKFAGGVTMTGTVTTDGAVGDAHIVDWSIRVREKTDWLFDPSNSNVLGDWGVSADRWNLFVSQLDPFDNPGSFRIGALPAFEFNGVFLGDFTNDPNGEAGLVTPSVWQTLSPLPLDRQARFQVGTAVPEPDSWATLLLGFAGIGALLRARRHREPRLAQRRPRAQALMSRA